MTLIHNGPACGKVQSGWPAGRMLLGISAAPGGAVRAWPEGAGGALQRSIRVLLQLSVMLDLAAFTRMRFRETGRCSWKRSCARVAERQTRWLQVPVSERAWGFKSPLAHAHKEPRSSDRGSFALTATAALRRAVPQVSGRTEALNRRRELARWLRIAAAAAVSSPSAMAAAMDRCSWTTWSKWSRA